MKAPNRLRIGRTLVGEVLHFFLLERFQEAFRLRVVVRIPDTVHPRLNTVKMQKFINRLARACAGGRLRR